MIRKANTDRRIHTLKLLTSSEQTYIKYLEILLDLYLRPMKKKDLGIRSRHFRIIFGNLETIWQITRVLHTLLEQCQQSQGAGLGETLHNLATFAKIYVPYISNIDSSFQLIKQLIQTNSRFRTFISKQEQDSVSNGFFFTTFLLLPIQRIQRYFSYFTDILSDSPKTDPDYPLILAALKLLSPVSSCVDDKRRYLDQSWRLVSIRNQLSGVYEAHNSIVIPNRRYLFEAPTRHSRTTLYQYANGEREDVSPNVLPHFIQLYIFTDSIFMVKCEIGKKYFGELIPLHLFEGMKAFSKKRTVGLDGAREFDTLVITLRIPKDYKTDRGGTSDKFESFFRISREEESEFIQSTLEFNFDNSSSCCDCYFYIAQAVQLLAKRRMSTEGHCPRPTPVLDIFNDVEYVRKPGQQGGGRVAFNQTAGAGRNVQQKAQEKQRKVFTMVLENENQFLEQLQIGMDRFFRPLKNYTRKYQSEGLGISVQDITDCFGHFKRISTMHEELTKEMEDVLKAKRIQLADVTHYLALVADIMDVYAPYLASLEKKLAKFMKFVEDNESFMQTVKKLEHADNADGFTVESVLNLPRYRVPVYVTVSAALYAICSTHSKEEEEEGGLKHSFDRIEAKVREIYEILQPSEDRDRVGQIGNSLFDMVDDPALLVQPHRRFIFESKVSHLCSVSEILPTAELNAGPLFARSVYKEVMDELTRRRSQHPRGTTQRGLDETLGLGASMRQTLRQTGNSPIRLDRRIVMESAGLLRRVNEMTPQAQMMKTARNKRRLQVSEEQETKALETNYGVESYLFLLSDALLACHVDLDGFRHYSDFFPFDSIESVENVEVPQSAGQTTGDKHILRVSMFRKKSRHNQIPISPQMAQIQLLASINGSTLSPSLMRETIQKHSISRKSLASMSTHTRSSEKKEEVVSEEERKTDYEFYSASFQFDSANALELFHDEMFRAISKRLHELTHEYVDKRQRESNL
ncbi:putative RhoGEF domain containing protein [Blattamonas nauphoetae]|uniref:RhoGEF domain containing protein n=1 Tax=Blattamonas nauphoetae TaxID=2049346 RepID=A0ABQ9Y6B2_9EUKA|nr:putative RhoGEF domain containing protein [Blattamonas nauphoetae]